jgi:predicted  nucleic acid-binding Zn-ribbon protein
MSSYTILAAEIDRITSSSYPSQLRTLHAAASNCSDADVSQWAAAKPCLVEPLASCLVEGLQQWSYVLEIITKFSLNAACRDAFLRNEPTLLHSVVAHAIKTGESKSKYVRASVALLSRPLPDTVALPAEVQTLFVQLVEHAAKKPSAYSIEPVYIILTGTGNLLLGILSTDVLARFEEDLVNILRHASSGAADQTLSLYCLSIMNVVLCGMDPEFRLTASSYNTQDFLASTPASTRWKSEAMQQFFAGNKAQRSTQLIALLVLSALSTADRSYSHVKSIVLANEVITAVPADLRQIWCAANTTTIRRIQEKLCTHELDARLKTLGLRFMGKLCEFDSLPHPVLENLQDTFLNPMSMQIVHTLSPHVNDCDLFSSVLARAPISHLLQNAVDYAIRADASELAAGLDAITRTMRDALTIIEDHKITVHQVREILGDDNFLQKLRILHDKLSSKDGEEQQGDGWCRTALHRKRSNLAHQITNLLLRASQKSAIGPQSMTLLLDLHASSARGEVQCDHGRSSWRAHLAFGQANNVYESGEDDVDWREALHTHFRARAEVEQDAVTALFTKACASLEARCENVEKPLRKTRERCLALEEHNNALQSAFAEMEAKNLEIGGAVRSAEDERDQYVHDLEQSRDANADLLERISDLEGKLRESQEEARRDLREAQNVRQMAELDNQASLAKKQEQFDDLQERYEETNGALADKRKLLSEMEIELRNSRAENAVLEERAESYQSRVQELQSTLTDLERNNNELLSTNHRLEESLSSATSSDADRTQQLNALRTDLENLNSSHSHLQETLAQSTAEIESLRHEIQTKDSHAQDLEASHRESTADYERQLSELRETHTFEIQTKDAKISETQKRVERYKRKCELKDEQIREAEAMRGNLMAAMGIKGSSIPLRAKELQTQETQEPDSTIMELDDDEGQAETPEPKRPRSAHRKSAPAPSLRMSMGRGGAERQSLGMVRPALRDVSANGGRRSLNVGFAAKTGRSPCKTAVIPEGMDGVGADVDD